MENFKFLIWAINESRTLMEEVCSKLLHTAKIFKIDIELLGIGHKFMEHKQRLVILRDYLKTIHHDTIVVCMDGGDTLFNDYPEVLMQKFREMNTRILISAERAYTHQYYEFKDKFDTIDSPYRYINAGTFMGYSGSLLQMMEEILILNEIYSHANDQGLLGIWVYQRFDQQDLFRLDINSEVFWVTTGEWAILKEVSSSHRFILNPETLTKATVIHCPGVGHLAHRYAYEAAFTNIVDQHVKLYCRIAVLTPFVSEPEGPLWGWDIEKKKDIELPVPVWDIITHPNISLFFYGQCDKMRESIIPTNYMHVAILRLEESYHLDCIVHIPSNYFLNPDELFTYINESFLTEESEIQSGEDFPKWESTVFYRGKYYPLKLAGRRVRESFFENRKNARKLHILARENRLNKLKCGKKKFSFDVISLGGWCGPAVALIHFKFRNQAYPFCMIHSTSECLTEILKDHRNAFFEEGAYTLMPHHNLQKPEVKETMNRRLQRFYDRLQDPRPILYVRTVIHENYHKEFEQMIEFMNILKSKYKRHDRLLLILHDQGIGTVKIKMIGYNIMVWAAEGKVGWKVANRTIIFRNYQRIIEYCLDEENWLNDEPQIRLHTIVDHQSYEICKELYPAVQKRRNDNIEL